MLNVIYENELDKLYSVNKLYVDNKRLNVIFLFYNSEGLKGYEIIRIPYEASSRSGAGGRFLYL